MYNQQQRHQDKQGHTKGLVGESTEVFIQLDNIDTKALLDTGSTVSTLSYSFYQKHLSHRPIQDLKDIFQLRCADGNSLPYRGFIETEIKAP